MVRCAGQRFRDKFLARAFVQIAEISTIHLREAVRVKCERVKVVPGYVLQAFFDGDFLQLAKYIGLRMPPASSCPDEYRCSRSWFRVSNLTGSRTAQR